MATFLDMSLIGSAKVIFTFLLVYVIIWGLLSWIRPFGKDVGTGPYAIIGLVGAFLTVISPTMKMLIEFVTPWFLFLVILIFFVLFAIRMFNVNEQNLFSIISQAPVYVMIIAIVVVIMIFGLAHVFGQQSLEATQGRADGGVYYQGPEPMETIGDGNSAGILQPVGGVEPLEPGDDLHSVGYPSGQLQPGQAGATATPDFSLNAVNTLLHPKVMAIIAMILIATVTVWMMARPEFI
jgi:hypothetical protein